jgi:Pretoxin HINT domain
MVTILPLLVKASTPRHFFTRGFSNAEVRVGSSRRHARSATSNPLIRSDAEPVPPSPRDAAGNGPYSGLGEAQGTGNRVTAAAGYTIAYDGESIGNATYGTAGNITAMSSPIDINQGHWNDWTYQFDARNRLIDVGRATRKYPGPVITQSYQVVYGYDTLDRLVSRQHSFQLGTNTPVTVAGHYLYAGGRPYADTDNNGTITVRYLFGPDGQPLARMDDRLMYYLSDRQNSVLQLVDGYGTTWKRLRYSGLEVNDRDGGVLKTDRFELGGQMYDHADGLAMLNGRWFDPFTGRHLTEGGPGIGLNPYPVAENNAPNAIKPPGDPWGDHAKPTGSETAKDVGEGVADSWWWRNGRYTPWGAGIWGWEAVFDWKDVPESKRAREVGKVTEGLWGLAYGMNPIGLAENMLPRNAANGELQMPWNWSVDGSVSRQVRGWQMSYDGYQKQGMNHNDALAWTISTNAPLLGSFYKGAEMYYGVSFQGTNFGDKLSASDYILNGVHIGVDVVMTAMGGAGVAARVAAPLRATSTLGRVASRFRTAVEVAGFATGQVTPWGAANMVRGSLGRAHRVVEGGLNKVVHGWMKNSQYHDTATRLAHRLGFDACFTGEMPMRTPDGSARADEVVVGMRLRSRNEFDPDGEVVWSVVEEVFKRQGLVTHLCLPKGVVIRSTNEHPFFVAGKGWTPLNQIKAGDEIRLEEPGWVVVEAVEETGVWETVYNFRIAEHHTYFVGCDEWGFSVWAHNQYDKKAFGTALEQLNTELATTGKAIPNQKKWISKQWYRNAMQKETANPAAFAEHVAKELHGNGALKGQVRAALLQAGLGNDVIAPALRKAFQARAEGGRFAMVGYHPRKGDPVITDVVLPRMRLKEGTAWQMVHFLGRSEGQNDRLVSVK